jgi:hypothetical protein
MKQSGLVRWVSFLAPIAGFCLWTSTARAEGNGKINISGLLDWYYQYGFNHPPAGSSLGARAFDIKNDAFSLSLAELVINRAPDDKIPVGFTTTLTFGKTADIVHLTEPGGTNTYKYVQQLYGTYVTGGPRPVTIDFGKFVTMMGYEVIESSSNDHYSRGLLFTLAIPFYHMGLRLTYPLSSTLTGQLHLVNGWNNVEDDNGGKSIGLQLNFRPSDKLNIILNWMGGQEGSDTVGASGLFGGIGFPAAGVLNVNTFDLLAILQLSSRLKVGLNVDYADASRQGLAGGRWNGQALYLRYQASDNTALGLRLEHFEDLNGLRLGSRNFLNSITGTFEYAVKGGLLHRFEIRHDGATNPIFPSGGGGGKEQTTVSFSQVIRF